MSYASVHKPSRQGLKYRKDKDGNIQIYSIEAEGRVWSTARNMGEIGYEGGVEDREGKRATILKGQINAYEILSGEIRKFMCVKIEFVDVEHPMFYIKFGSADEIIKYTEMEMEKKEKMVQDMDMIKMLLRNPISSNPEP